MSETTCPHCGNDLTGEEGLGICIDVAEIVRYSAVLREDDREVWAEASTASAQRAGRVVRTLCGGCYAEVDAIPMLDGQAV